MKLVKLHVEPELYGGKLEIEPVICSLGRTKKLDKFLDDINFDTNYEEGGNLLFPVLVVSRKVFRSICEIAQSSKSNHSYQKLSHNGYPQLNTRALKMLGYVHEGAVFVPSTEVNDDELFYWNGKYEESNNKKKVVLIVDRDTEVSIVNNSNNLNEIIRGTSNNDIIIFKSRVDNNLIIDVLNPTLLENKGKLHKIK